MRVQNEDLKKFIIDAGLIKKAQLDIIEKRVKKSGENLEDVLISEKLVDQEQIAKLKAYMIGIPFANLEKDNIPIEILKIIPEPIARSNNIIAFRKSGNQLEVAMLDPEDLRTIEFIKKKSNLKILPRLTTPKGIKNALQQYQKTLQAEFGDIIKSESESIQNLTGEEAEQDETTGEDLKKVAKELPIIKIVDTLMKHAIIQKASDIHIEPSDKEVLVRYRIDGILRNAMSLPKNVSSGIVARIKVLSNLKLDEHRLPQDGRFKIETDDYKYSIRVSVLPVFGGEKIVMRLLAEGSQAFSLEALGIRGESLERVQKALNRPVGMILVTGPTGSGKTTTLYSMMEILNTPEVNISTIEDPIEYRMQRINQTQVNPKIGLTFSSGLRSLVRQDPDIIMVGEIRDNETVSLAINAALTGHLVLSTLHTIDSAGAVPRLIDMQAEPFLISSTLNVIIAQRLVRKLISKDEKYHLTQDQIKDFAKYCDLDRVLKILKEEKIIKDKDTWSDVVFYKPTPTKDSVDGFGGRIGIYEVLEITETIKQLIIQKVDSEKIKIQALSEGMRSMVEDGFVKAAQGLTTIEEVLRVITE